MRADPPTATRTNRAVLVAVWAASAWYVATRIDRAWGPPDEGLLGQTAERLLRGELPHRDFDDLYTGGLTALHALAFDLFGIRLIVLRVVLFVAFVLWVPAVYALARRFAGAVLAGSITLLAVVWSVPAYPASMPSWYNLFLATAGLLCLFRYVETDRVRWIFAAGVCVGLSMLAKIVGIYLLAALELCLLYRAFLPGATPTVAIAAVGDFGTAAAGRSRWLATALANCSACVLILALLWLVRAAETPGTYLQFVVPGAAVAVVMARTGNSAARVDWARLWGPSIALVLGAALAVAPMVAVYAHAHALGDLAAGVFIRPMRRLSAVVREPHIWAAAASLPLVGVATIAARARRPALRALTAVLIVLLGIGLIVVSVRNDGLGPVRTGQRNDTYRLVIDSVSNLVPIIATAFAVFSLSGSARSATQLDRERAFAAVAVMALCALIGFPFSNDLYFYYIAPLMLIALVAVYAMWGRAQSSWIGGATIAFYLAFGVCRVDVGSSARLALARGGLRVSAHDSAAAIAFVDTLRSHARNGYTFATPDSPEAYFLSGLANPSRTMYDLFDDTTGRDDRILAMLDSHRITAVAISYWTIFSPGPDARLLAALRARYPDSTVVWHFTVRWKP